MNRLERDLWRVTVRQLWLTPRVGWANVRFLLGVRIGHFHTASRDARRVKL